MGCSAEASGSNSRSPPTRGVAYLVVLGAVLVLAAAVWQAGRRGRRGLRADRVGDAQVGAAQVGAVQVGTAQVGAAQGRRRSGRRGPGWRRSGRRGSGWRLPGGRRRAAKSTRLAGRCAKAVLAYLSSYTHCVAISNRRLIAADAGAVTFKIKDCRIDGTGVPQTSCAPGRASQENSLPMGRDCRYEQNWTGGFRGGLFGGRGLGKVSGDAARRRGRQSSS
jgi:hypothetical protein